MMMDTSQPPPTVSGARTPSGGMLPRPDMRQPAPRIYRAGAPPCTSDSSAFGNAAEGSATAGNDSACTMIVDATSTL